MAGPPPSRLCDYGREDDYFDKVLSLDNRIDELERLQDRCDILSDRYDELQERIDDLQDELDELDEFDDFKLLRFNLLNFVYIC